MKKLLLFVLIGTIISLSLVGCEGNRERPSEEHPTSEHQPSEHPE